MDMRMSGRSKNHIAFSMISLLLLCFSFAGCSDSEPELIDPVNLKIINTKPILQMTTEGDNQYFSPSETLAAHFVELLEKSNLQQNVKACAAADGYKAMGEKSKKCIYGDDDLNEECAVKEGYWKGYLHKQLNAKKMDLNNDNVPDYIVSGDSCTGFSHNYTSEFFVFLSQKDGTYMLALSTSASFISVVPKANGNGYLIVDGTNSYNGDSANMWSLEGAKYTNIACFYQSHTEKLQAYRNAKCN